MSKTNGHDIISDTPHMMSNKKTWALDLTPYQILWLKP